MKEGSTVWFNMRLTVRRRLSKHGETLRQVVIYPGPDGYWVAECPSLPGCVSQARTREEASQNIKDARQGYIAALEEHRLPVPEEQFEVLVMAG